MCKWLNVLLSDNKEWVVEIYFSGQFEDREKGYCREVKDYWCKMIFFFLRVN